MKVSYDHHATLFDRVHAGHYAMTIHFRIFRLSGEIEVLYHYYEDYISSREKVVVYVSIVAYNKKYRLEGVSKLIH